MINNFDMPSSHGIIEGIECDVTHCYYNTDNRECAAGHITVGTLTANKTDDTLCATFRPE